MDALLYTRVSKDDQVKYGMSLQTQLDDLTRYCSENHLNIRKVYSDEGISGGSVKKRQAFQNMIVESRPGEIILFTKLDRFSRNLLDANITVQELDKKNVSIKAIHEDDIDTSTADGKFIFNLKLSLAQREREKVSERIKDVFAYRAREGLMNTGNPPLGYKIIDKRLVIDEENCEKIRELFDMYEELGSIRQTTQWWNMTYPENTCTYNDIRDNKLKNMYYKGCHPTGVNDHFCEPIITHEQFDRVQDRLSKNIKSMCKVNRVYLFTGLVHCPECGCVMVGQARRQQIYYRCNNAFVNHRCSNRTMTKEKIIEGVLLADMDSVMGDDTYDLDLTPKKPAVEKSQIENKIARLKELYVEGLIDRNKFDAKYKQLNDQIAELERSEPVIKRELKDVNFRQMYDMLTQENKRSFWHRFVKEIYRDKVVYY